MTTSTDSAVMPILTTEMHFGFHKGICEEHAGNQRDCADCAEGKMDPPLTPSRISAHAEQPFWFPSRLRDI